MDKRFTLTDTFMIIDNEKLEVISPLMNSKDVGKVCGLLNELHEENHQLKRQIGNLEHTRDFCAECCERLEKENEQLKNICKNLIHKVNKRGITVTMTDNCKELLE